MWLLEPAARAGEPAFTVMASTAKRGTVAYAGDKGFLPGNLELSEYERLQGVEPGHLEALRAAGASRHLCVHLLGNGVPLSMGVEIATAIRNQSARVAA